METQLIPLLRFPTFQDKWEKVIISNIANKVTDGTHDTPKPIKEGIPFLTAIHVKDGKIDFDNCYYLSKEEHNKIYKRCNPEFGDLLMVNIGAGTATSAMVNVNYEFSLKNVALIKPNKTKIYPSFFAQVQRKNSDRLRHQISSGGAQPFLSLKAIGKLKLNIPSLPEQQKIASFLSDVDEKITQLTKKKTLLEQYKKGVMQKIFNQELRFKDDNGKDFPDWGEKKLGEIFKVSAGGDIDKNNVSKKKSGDFRFPIFANSEKQKGLFGYSNIYKIDFECVTITGRGSLGHAIARYEKFYPIVRLLVLKPKINLNVFFFENAINQLNILSESTGVPQLTAPQISTYKINFPNVEEQTKIANFLSDIDIKIEALSTKIENSKTFKKGLLQQMFV